MVLGIESTFTLNSGLKAFCKTLARKMEMAKASNALKALVIWIFVMQRIGGVGGMLISTLCTPHVLTKHTKKAKEKGICRA
jgi:hypothetical protein